MTTERSQLFGSRPAPRSRPVKPFSAALVLAAIFGTFGVPPASAQGFISPFVGYIFGGDAGCPAVADCEDKHLHYGVSFGAIGSIVGFEGEFAYTPDFFGQSSNQTSNVLTFMANLMLAPKIGPVQPYGVGGVGLIRNSVTAGTTTDQNQLGWDVGGGLIVYFSKHVGVRGDVRYYKSFQLLDFVNLPNLPETDLRGTRLDFDRFAIAAVFKF